jgi:hypothetical protein
VGDEYARKQRDGMVHALTESKGRVGGPDGAAARLGTSLKPAKGSWLVSTLL